MSSSKYKPYDSGEYSDSYISDVEIANLIVNVIQASVIFFDFKMFTI